MFAKLSLKEQPGPLRVPRAVEAPAEAHWDRSLSGTGRSLPRARREGTRGKGRKSENPPPAPTGAPRVPRGLPAVPERVDRRVAEPDDGHGRAPGAPLHAERSRGVPCPRASPARRPPSPPVTAGPARPPACGAASAGAAKCGTWTLFLRKDAH